MDSPANNSPQPAKQPTNSRVPQLGNVTLSEADALALDHLLDAMAATPHLKFSGDLSEKPTPASVDAQRLAAMKRVLQLLEQLPVENPSAELASRTVAHVRDFELRQKFLQQINDHDSGSARGLSWPSILGIAAIFAIGISLALPVLSFQREESRRISCLANLAGAGQAVGMYASSQDVLPRLGAWPGSPWYKVGQQQPEPNGEVHSNSAHLYLLAREGYIDPDRLTCPDNPNAARGMNAKMQDWPEYKAVSYSYQNQYSPKPTRLDRNPDMAILADKNPLFTSNTRNPKRICVNDLPCCTPSQMHQGSGQNVLMASGQARWLPKPVLSNGDNIWLARGVSKYVGNEMPADADDSFLVP